MKIIDLTHILDSSTPVYPGDPKSSLSQTAYLNKDTYNDHKLITQMHVGTHIDAPLHMIAGGRGIDEISLDTFIGNGVLLNVENKKTIDVEDLRNCIVNPGDILLIYTGFSKDYGDQKYFDESPFLTKEFAEELVKLKIKSVGLDFSGPDVDSSWPAHKILLGNEILIMENLVNLDKLVDEKKFEVIGLPLKLKSDASPLRVVAKVI